jgi:RNA polymerase sigma-70 factor (ECF subfamily)
MVDEETIADEEVIKKVLSGDSDLYRVLVSRHQNLVFGMIMRQTGNRDLAEELTQETFIKAFTALQSFRAEAKFSTWITRIALNHTNSYFTSKAHKQRKRSDSFDIELHDKNDTSATEEHELRERMRKFQSCLGKVKPTFREIITLCGLQGKSYEDAASLLDIPIGTVRSRLNKARLLLRDCMNREEHPTGV